MACPLAGIPGIASPNREQLVTESLALEARLQRRQSVESKLACEVYKIATNRDDLQNQSVYMKSAA